MDVVERYLQAVKLFLPAKTRDDIISELAQNLGAEIEDREGELDRSLSEAEVAAIVKQHGHPALVASRYRQGQALIGGVLFPIYLFVLQVGLAICLLVTAVFACFSIIVEGNAAEHLVGALLAFPARAVVVLGWTTLAFAIAERVGLYARLTSSWDPLTLPKLVADEQIISRGRALFELVAVLAGLGWLFALTQAPSLALGPAASILEFAPIWRVAFPLIVLATLGTAALQATNLMRPYWTPTRSKLRLLAQGASLAVLGLLLQAGSWFVPVATSATPNSESLVRIIDASAGVGLAIAGLITLVEMAREFGRLRRGGPSTRLDTRAPCTAR